MMDFQIGAAVCPQKRRVPGASFAFSVCPGQDFGDDVGIALEDAGQDDVLFRHRWRLLKSRRTRFRCVCQRLSNLIIQRQGRFVKCCHLAKPVHKIGVHPAQAGFITCDALQIREVIHDRLQRDHKVAWAPFDYAVKHEPEAIRADDSLECFATAHGKKTADVSARSAFRYAVPRREIFLRVGQFCALVKYLLCRFIRSGKHFGCNPGLCHIPMSYLIKNLSRLAALLIHAGARPRPDHVSPVFGF